MSNIESRENDETKDSSLGNYRIAFYLMSAFVVLMIAGIGYLFYSLDLISLIMQDHKLISSTTSEFRDIKREQKRSPINPLTPVELMVNNDTPTNTAGIIFQEKNKPHATTRIASRNTDSEGDNSDSTLFTDPEDKHTKTVFESTKDNTTNLSSYIISPDSKKNIGLLAQLSLELFDTKTKVNTLTQLVKKKESAPKPTLNKVVCSTETAEELINKVEILKQKNHQLSKGIKWLKWGYKNNPMPGWRVAGIDKGYALVTDGDTVKRLTEGMSIDQITISKIAVTENRVETNRGFIY
ncbi:MAG: hypothetical protein ABW148_10295 [Sedimenticola sp.]